MCMQKNILKQYQDLNPELTLKEISKDTGVQITRVFRLMNGYEMKTSEYEKFHHAILRKQNQKSLDILKISEQCLLKLESKQLQELTNFLERKLHLHQLSEKMQFDASMQQPANI